MITAQTREQQPRMGSLRLQVKAREGRGERGGGGEGQGDRSRNNTREMLPVAGWSSWYVRLLTASA